MGANMMPTMKKMGKTVLGVRMGLQPHVSYRDLPVPVCGGSRTAMLLIAAAGKQYLGAYQSLILYARGRPRCRAAVFAVCWWVLTWGSPALCLLVRVVVRILARDRVALLDLLRLRHGRCSARIRSVGGRVVGYGRRACV